MIDNPVLLALNICTLTTITLTANLLVLRSFRHQTYLPLAICFIAVGVIICQPFLAVFSPNLQVTALIFSLPAILLIGPCFWFYVQGLTSETPWRFSRKVIPDLIPFGIGAIIALISFLMPSEIKNALLVTGNDQIVASVPIALRYLIYGVLITVFILVLGWVVQSGFYLYKIIKRLNQYRRQLKNLFASTESKEIRWLTWLLVAVVGVWLAAAINIVLDNLFFSSQLDALAANIIVLVMIWSVAIWGLRQKPGFEELYNSTDGIEEVLISPEVNQAKYQRSALDKTKSNQIAAKIESAMHKDKLYLDASLSLQKLAKHINTSPNYISQTLNETLGVSFFDLINQYRIEDAKRGLAFTKETVLDIAMNVGFNAKSSFYTAFKKETQQTPSQYRKQHQAQDKA